MNVFNGNVCVTALSVFAFWAGSCGPGSAAPRSACQILSASKVTTIVGKPVEANAPTDVSEKTSVCLYTLGKVPVAQLLVYTADNESAATRVANQNGLADKKNAATQQKGNAVLSINAMNGYTDKIHTLLDAAVRNL